jgi:hypothetical protein
MPIFMGLPLQEAFPKMGGIRGFRVPPKYPSRLGAASTPEVQHLRQRTIKALYLTSYRFGPVGYRQQNAGFYIAVKQSKQLFKRLHVALIDIVHRWKIQN